MILYNINMRKKKEKNVAFGITEGEKKVSQTTDPAVEQVQKDYLSMMYHLNKQKNNLLGGFSVDGKYSIKDENILQELVRLPKKFDYKENEVVYATTKLGEFVLNFKIELNIKPDFCNAKLSIIEVEHGVEEDVKHVTSLGEHLDVYSPKFKEDVYKMWKVYFEEEVYEKNDFLHKYLHMQQEEYLFNLELTEILAQLYLVRMLKVLETSGEFGEKIFIKYRDLVDKFALKDPSIRSNNIKLKEILDSIIMKEKALPELLKLKDASVALSGYANPLKRVVEKKTPSMVQEVGKQPQKEEKKADKKTTKSTKKKKSKGGGGAVKPFIADAGKIFGKYTGGGSVTIPKFGEKKAEKPIMFKEAKIEKGENPPIEELKEDDIWAQAEMLSGKTLGGQSKIYGGTPEKSGNIDPTIVAEDGKMSKGRNNTVYPMTDPKNLKQGNEITYS